MSICHYRIPMWGQKSWKRILQHSFQVAPRQHYQKKTKKLRFLNTTKSKTRWPFRFIQNWNISWESEKELTMFFFMRSSRSCSVISAISKIELRSTTAPFSLFNFLLQCNAMHIEKIGTKWIFTRPASGWDATCAFYKWGKLLDKDKTKNQTN